MSFNLTGDNVKIFKKEKTYERDGQQKSFFTYSFGIASKNGENWANGYIDCAFKKDDAAKITNKCKIKINKAFPTVTVSNGKSYVKWMITDFEIVEPGEVENPIDPDGFVNIPDGMADEMPFL